MFSPLLQSIIARHDYSIVTEDTHDALTGAEDYSVLLFAGDAERLAESDDVAVVLPELVKAFEGVFRPFVVERDSERALQRRYRFNAYPALVFLKDGAYLGTLQQVRDWNDYLTDIADILTRAPSEPPPYQFPEGCAVPPPSLSH